MSEIAAAPAAAAAPTNAAPPSEPGNDGAEGVQNETPAQRERRRIVLAELADDDEFVLNVDGQEVVESAAELRRKRQQNESATRKFQAAKQAMVEAKQQIESARQEATEMLELLKNPRQLAAAIADAGGDPAAYLKMVTDALTEETSLTAEARELRRIKAQQQKAAAEQQRAQQAAYQRQVQHFTKQYTDRLNRISDTAGVPKDPTIREHVTMAQVRVVARAVERGEVAQEADLIKATLDAYQGVRRAYLATAGVNPDAPKPPTSPIKAAPSLPDDGTTQRDASGRFLPQRGRFGLGIANGQHIARSAMDAFRKANG